MSNDNLEITFDVDASPDDVFAAINNVRGWWSGEITGDTDRPGAEFTYKYADLHRSTQRITEFLPGSRVVWRVIDSYLSFIEDKSEWNGSDIVFDIEPLGDGARLTFSHIGLTPDVECYDSCSPAWQFYISASLRNLITTGVGASNATKGTGAVTA